MSRVSSYEIFQVGRIQRRVIIDLSCVGHPLWALWHHSQVFVSKPIRAGKPEAGASVDGVERVRFVNVVDDAVRFHSM